MKQLRRTPLPLAAWLALTLLAVGSAGPAAASHHPLKIVPEPGARLIPTQVEHRWTADGLEITGRIEKRADHYGRILGHVDIELLDADGNVVKRDTGSLQHFSPRRKDPDWASFYALIRDVPDSVTEIRLRHGVGPRW